jgi:predicted porin
MTKIKCSYLIGLACLQLTSVQSYANTTSEFALFGNFRGSFNAVDDPICAGKCSEDTNTDQNGLSFRNNASILGLRGSVTQNDLTGYFKYIMRAHNDEIFDDGSTSTIIYTAGFRGIIGDISYGIGSTPFKVSGMKLDPFWDTSGSARGFDGPSIGLSNLTWGFSKNMLQWNSYQMFDKVKLEAAIIVDDTNADKHDINIGASYSNNDISFGVQYIQLDDSKATAKSPGAGYGSRLWGSYKQEVWDVSFSAEDIALDDREDQRHYFVSSNIHLSKKIKLTLSYGISDIVDDIALDGSGGSVGVFYDILPKTNVYALFNKISRDQSENRRVFSIGVVHKFSGKF